MIRRLAIVLLAAAVSLVAGAAGGAQTGPLTLEGELGGAPYRIVVPANWNGTLLVHAHAYRDKADHPGEVDDRSAPAALNPALEAALTAAGYAVAGSAYRDNGWAVKEGGRDIRALTSFFNGVAGKPATTLLWGFSMGSLVSLSEAEQTNGHYDGVLSACAVAAGSPRAWDGALAHLLAYDAAFGMPAAWGTPGDVADGVDFETQVAPKLALELASDPLGAFGKVEFIRLVTQVAGPGTIPAPAGWLPGGYFTNMFFLTEARGELERRAGGPIAQNLTHTYALTAAEKTYLAGLGVNADVLLARMNASRWSAKPSARNYLEHYADPSGELKVPMLTLHTRTDTLVPPAHERAYAQTVAEAGSSSLLRQAFTTGNGHCAFTGPQLIAAVQVLEAWAKTGVPPTAASFPAALGFDPAFTPPPWQFPEG
jgi:hypothetical protein